MRSSGESNRAVKNELLAIASGDSLCVWVPLGPISWETNPGSALRGNSENSLIVVTGLREGERTCQRSHATYTASQMPSAKNIGNAEGPHTGVLVL